MAGFDANMLMPQSAVGACGHLVLPQNTDSAGAFTSLRGLRTFLLTRDL